MNPKIEWLLLKDSRSVYESVKVIKLSNGFPVETEHVIVEDPSSFCKGFIVAKNHDNVKVYELTDA